MIDGKSFIEKYFDKEPLDQEIKKLVYLINQVDGVETIGSCFGHHKMLCRIGIRIKDVDTANKFIKRFFYFDPLWSLKLTFIETDYQDELLFTLESAYQDYPTVDLMVENLTSRFSKRLVEIEELGKGKSTLVIDTPDTCGDCPFCIFTAEEKRYIAITNTSDEDYYCKVLDRFMEYDKVDGGVDILGKPIDCPLQAGSEV